MVSIWYLRRVYIVPNQTLMVNLAIDQLHILQTGCRLFSWARRPFALNLSSANFINDSNVRDRLRATFLRGLLKRLILIRIITRHRSRPARSQLRKVVLPPLVILTFFILPLLQVIFHLLIFTYNIILPILKLKSDLIWQFPSQMVDIAHVLHIDYPLLFLL